MNYHNLASLIKRAKRNNNLFMQGIKSESVSDSLSFIKLHMVVGFWANDEEFFLGLIRDSSV